MKKCLNLHELYKLSRSGEPQGSSLAQRMAHLEACPACSDELELVKSLLAVRREQRSDTTNETRRQRSEHIACDAEERYFQGALDGNDLENFQRHLNECNGCFEEFSRVSKMAFSGLGDEERSALAEIETVEIADRLAPYKSQFRAPLAHRAPTQARRGRMPVFRFAYYALLVVLVGAGYVGFRIYERFQVLSKADALFASLVSDHRLRDGELRPTGGFEFRPIGLTRGSGSQQADAELDDIQQALKIKPADALLNQYMGLARYLDNNISEARKYYSQAKVLDEDNAKIYNDLALVCFREGKAQEALSHLEHAIELDPGLLEAYYNIALIHEKKNDKADALRAWRRYRDVEPDVNSDWHKIARKHIMDLSE